jgi:hypothetical protein
MTAGQAATRPIRPEECAVGFGIPTSESTYRASPRDGNEPFFAKNFSCYPEYENRFLRPYRTATRSMERSGVRIVPDLSLALLGELLRSPEIQVVILFSHWEKDSVEMRGSFASVPEIVHRVPLGAAKIVDLTICGCVALAEALVRNRPDCLVRISLKEGDSHGAKLEPALWLGLLRRLFLLLKRAPKSYPQAWEELLIGARSHVSRRS